MSDQPTIHSVKGTRDFYPDEMRIRNWMVDTWRRVSLRNGFEEYDAPIFEYLDLFTIKSGDEIAEQLFNFTDRGGRNLAIRPEITPSLARMVNAKINSLPRPLKWFSVPRLCRAENPQKGRLREFFQWNVDVIGSDEIVADAECIYTAVDFLREVGLTGKDAVVRIGSRPLTIAALAAGGLPADMTDAALAVLDKRPKLDEAEFAKLTAATHLTDEHLAGVCRLQDCQTPDEVRDALPECKVCAESLDELERLMATLTTMGVGDYCKLDLRIVRGLAYYTGVVYEVFDAADSLRAVAGGGRYDNLLEVLGGPKVGATGFGMGDVVLAILLADKDHLPHGAGRLDYFVIDGEGCQMPRLLHVVSQLRKRGVAADFSYKRVNIGKQLKEANRRGAASAVIVRGAGEPISIKNLSSGNQADQALDEFFSLLEKTV
ncbi:MAG: histidine--tRNA ligase [Planctomycetota bacterium]|jgi:histidyl-tRNA synthetase